jgi:hypothetical protein
MVPRHAKLVAYECELIGLVQAVRHWRAYLWGRSFLVRTGHYSLKFLLDQCLSTIPQHQWASKLLGFDFRVEYKPGKMNVVADALSRRDTEMSAEAMALSTPSFQLFEDLRAAYTTDATLTSVRQEVRDRLHGKHLCARLLAVGGRAPGHDARCWTRRHLEDTPPAPRRLLRSRRTNHRPRLCAWLHHMQEEQD